MHNLEDLKEKIRNAEIVSFDVFDTLLLRVVDRPLAVFEILEKHLKINDFSKLRPNLQNKASEKVMEKQKFPHANLREIYQEIKEQLKNTEIEKIKNAEIELEKDCLYQNKEMFEIFEYTKKLQKKIIITTDMYLDKLTIQEFLESCGYTGFEKIYDSANERCAKFNGTLFEHIIKSEKISPEKILHIGDNKKDDIENAQKFGIETFYYKNSFDIPKSKPEYLIDSWKNGLTKKMFLEKKLSPENFWQKLGFQIGGPIYIRLYDYIEKKVEKNKNFYFLARDGYNLFEIDKKYNKIKGNYLYSSRRSLLLAGVDQINEETIAKLPPFTIGQTVKEILDYLNFPLTQEDLKQVNLQKETVIKTTEDIENFKKIYQIFQAKFLKVCKEEKKYALAYFKKLGLFEKDAIIFDCGWHGSSQYLLTKFLKQNGYKHHIKFYYVGIHSNEKSLKQLQNLDYETCFFDITSKNEYLDEIIKSVVLAELFFGAPDSSVLRYDKNGVVKENIETDFEYKKEILEGIKLFIKEGQDFYDKYLRNIDSIEFLKPLYELIINPTKKEAKTIGNIKNIDGFANTEKKPKYIAYLKKEDIIENPFTEIYWPQGLLVRDDIENSVKHFVMKEPISKLKRIVKKTPFYKIYHRLRKIMYTEGLYTFSYKKLKSAKKRLISHGSDYDIWIKNNEKKNYDYEIDFTYNPKISIVVPVYNVIKEQLEECIESVLNQTYKNYELIMIDDASTLQSIRPTLEKYVDKPKIIIDFHTKNEQISKTTNDCIEKSSGEFIAFLDCDDTLAPDALESVVKKLNEDSSLDFIYSDEDKLTEDGTKRHSPFFKPDWSKDTFLSLMYTCHFSVYRKKIVEKINGLTVGLDGAQDYDFTLRFINMTDKIGHIPKILYHWRERKESIASNPEAKPYALNAIKKLKENYLKENNLKGHVEYDNEVFQYRIVYEEKNNALVSIIILSKDHPKILETCVKSIKEKTGYKNYEIIVMDNGSEKENKLKYEELSKKYKFQYYYEKLDFNFSKMCNLGTKKAKGTYYLFLNDDVEIITNTWLERLLGQASQKHTGAVGAKLYYPNSKIIQHDGIVNLRHGPSHILMGQDDSKLYYYCNNRLDYNYLAVTGACLMISQKKFAEVQGYDEQLPVAYNDVDLCFKLHKLGYSNIVRNDVLLYHYESLSRGNDIVNIEKINRLRKEKKYLYLKHPEYLGKDPYYNPNLDQTSIDFKIDANIKELCKVKEIPEKIEETKEEICYALEKIETEDNKIEIYGYALIEKYNHNNKNKIKIILQSKTNTYEIFTKKIYRSDLANIYINHCHLAGFKAYAKTEKITSGKYEIFIKLENKKDKIKIIKNTEFYVEVKNEKNN